MFKLPTLGFLVVFVAAPLGSSADQAPQAPSSESTALASLIEQVDGQYTRISDRVWRVTYQSKHLTPLAVNVTATEDVIFFFVSLVPRDKMPFSQNVLVKLLELNHQYDYVKICLDKDEIYVRGDLASPGLTPKRFEAFESQVALAADEIYAVVKGFLPY